MTCLRALLLACAASLPAQQPSPPVRALGATTATSAETFGGNVTVRQHSAGVLIHDALKRRVLSLDDNLDNASVILDTTDATGNAYGTLPGNIIPYRGDSTLYVDLQSMSLLVIDHQGKLTGRVLSIPGSLSAGLLRNAAFDPSGRLVAMGTPRIEMRSATAAGGAAPTGMMMAPELPDSMAVFRVSLATRAADTVGFVKTPRVKLELMRDEATGAMRVTSQVNPLPTVDDWAVLSDGSIALVRGRDYHVDWVRPDGTRESSPKIPFDWQRLTDDDKVAFIDSVTAARERILAAQAAQRPQVAGTAAGSAPAPAPGPAGPGGEMRVMIRTADGGMPMPASGSGAARGGGAAVASPMAGGGMPATAMTPTITFVPPEELPDYKPAFLSGAARPDAAGNLWVLTIPTKAIAGGSVYDVINGKGQLIDRVQVPAGRRIVGFGPANVVYLLATDPSSSRLEKATVR